LARSGGGTRSRARAAVVVTLVVLAVVAAAVVGVVRFLGSRPEAPTSHPTPIPSLSTVPSQTSTPTPAPSGHRYVVDPGGSNHDAGTQAAPWRTLKKALTSLHAGDTLTVREGTYSERLDDIEVNPGTKKKPVTVVAAPGATPVLRGLLWLPDANYWSFRGLNVTWSHHNSSDDHMIKFDGGTGWSFTDAEVSDARSYAAILVTGDATNWRLSGLFVHNTHRTHDDNQDQLIYVSSTDGGGVIEHCLLTDSPNGRAVKIGPPDKTPDPIRGVTVRYNTMYSNLGPSNVQLSRGAEDNRIYRNIMSLPGKDQPNVTAYELTGQGNVVYDNLVYDSSGAVTTGVDGLEDGGGNLQQDPGFTDVSRNNFVPKDTLALSYGAYAR
jgi:hypothetical protein